MRIPNYARYGFVYQHIFDFFFDFHVTDFPISPLNIIDEMDNCHAFTYEEYADALGNYDSKDLIDQYHTDDGFTLYDKEEYFIIYNDEKPFDRVNFTLMHEIGHIYLNHFRDFEQLKIARGGITDSEYRVLENEANSFARNILSPIVLIDYCGIPYDLINDVFSISYQAQTTRVSFAITDRRYFNEYRTCMLLELFYPFIHKKLCFNCNASFISRGRHCPICGSDNTLWDCREMSKDSRWRNYREEFKTGMIYSGIDLDEEKKAIVCPNCDNEEIVQDGAFCIICGENLTNFCEGYINERGFPEEEGCGKKLPGNARFCPHCGCMSHFYNRDFLTPWNTALDTSETFGSSDAVFQIDEEIPF